MIEQVRSGVTAQHAQHLSTLEQDGQSYASGARHGIAFLWRGRFGKRDLIQRTWRGLNRGLAKLCEKGGDRSQSVKINGAREIVGM
jgi:hypothetical protein